MDLLQNLPELLQPAPSKHLSTQLSPLPSQGQRFLQSGLNTQPLAPQMEIHLILPHCRQLCVKYVGLEHFNYLLGILKKFHGVQYNMARDNFLGMDIEWNYAAPRCHISMPGYISMLRLKIKHPHPAKPWLSPY
jgi:hypothetical protein